MKRCLSELAAELSATHGLEHTSLSARVLQEGNRSLYTPVRAKRSWPTLLLRTQNGCLSDASMASTGGSSLRRWEEAGLHDQVASGATRGEGKEEEGGRRSLRTSPHSGKMSWVKRLRR